MTVPPPRDDTNPVHWLVYVATAYELNQLKRPLQLQPVGKEGSAPCFEGRVGPHHLTVFQTGIGPARAFQVAAFTLNRRPCHGVISVGLSGGLRPGLPSGSLVIGDRWVRVEGGLTGTVRHIGPPTDQRLKGAVLRAARDCGLAVKEGWLATSDCLVGLSGDKHALAARTDALAVDMESGAVAEAALAAGVSVVAVRAILDAVDEALPLSPESFLLADGSTSIWKSGVAIAVRPSQWPVLWGVGRRSARAMALLACWLCRLWDQEPAAQDADRQSA
jgi:adenosylhomocysteine nucleosidase